MPLGQDVSQRGRHHCRWRQAGIEVDVGLGADAAWSIMAGFFHRIETGKSLVTISDIDDDLSYILEGYDAIVRSSPDQLWILTRTPGVCVLAKQVEHPGYAWEPMLQRLGKLELTSVFIPSEDPLSTAQR